MYKKIVQMNNSFIQNEHQRRKYLMEERQRRNRFMGWVLILIMLLFILPTYNLTQSYQQLLERRQQLADLKKQYQELSDEKDKESNLATKLKDETYAAKYLRAENMTVDTCFNGQQAIDYVNTSSYDVIVMDIMMPILDGISALAQMRNDGNTTPVLLLTAKDSLQDKVTGLNTGADDYLVKPFDLEELTARIYALARRNARHAQNDIHVGPLTINVPQRTVKRDGETITLTAKEFDLLFYLASNENIVLSRQQILDHVWEYDYESYSNLIDVYIKDLRKKIDTDENVKLIQTVRGVGYVLKTEN